MDAISKAFEILEVFLKADKDIGISELARITNIKVSTVHRITSILIKRGYLVQRRKGGKYFLSLTKVVDYTSVMRRRLTVRNIALPYLQRLSEEVDESGHLSFRLGQVAFHTDVININHILNVIPNDNTFSLYSTGVGKVFLADMSQKDFEAYCNSVILKPRTSNTITSFDYLKKELNKVREEGVAFDDEEHEVGVRDVVAPIKDCDNNTIAAIGVLCPSSRVSRQKMFELAPTVKEYALIISKAMGYEDNH